MSHVSDKRATGVIDDLDLYTRIYRQMLLIRGFEELVQSLFLAGEVYGTTHLYSGQEAIATGVASVLEERDRVAATYRGHGHALALGVDPQELLDEMLGRESGVNGGRAGSMNVNSPDDRLIGSFGIVGGSIAAATGAALALKRTTGGVAVAYFGDGAMNQGYVFECLNFCQVFRLPLVLVCENNGYGEYTPFRSVTAGEIRARAEIMEVPAETIDGMSVWTVREAADRAVAHAR
ncbi:MAG TPA: thiamine pyrophosphate-dependent dehydrogenase E1 component subunit alpha, partial [Gaiellaceae bacterium]